MQWEDVVRRVHALLWMFHRGFVDTISLSIRNFHTHGEELLAREPIQNLTLHNPDRQVAELASLRLSTKIRILNFMREGLTDTDIETLIALPLFPSLHLLNLSDNHITDRGARLLSEQSSFPLLRCVNLDYNVLTQEGIAALRHGRWTFSAENQRPEGASEAARAILERYMRRGRE